MRAICRYMGEPVTLVQVTRDYSYRDGKLGDFGVPGERVCTSIYRTSLILAFGPLALPAPHHDDAIYSVQSHLDFGVTSSTKDLCVSTQRATISGLQAMQQQKDLRGILLLLVETAELHSLVVMLYSTTSRGFSLLTLLQG